ncbi:terminase small subunit [Bradyrhizobium symbiodeficiens]|uniref:terminase small subunit n=1 Tax=Bradyrhizobium symbiodeficiens TaxID=1404367 RepID=UPI000BA1A31A|nr:terminase small subunit [Bradyrhizobium symbiodeficiens]AWM07728.1 hypothetical protein CIT39_15585 [Bradyrhizobium symbiodeficiens]
MAPLKNLKHERFIHLLLEGSKHGWNAAEAYRRVYGAEGHVAESAASRLLKNVEVQARLAELAAPQERKARVTVQSLLGELQTTIADARQAKQHSVVVQSLALAAKLCGMLTDRIEVGAPGEFGTCKTGEEVVDLLLEEQSPQATLAQLDELRELILARAAAGARVVEPRSVEWSTMIERRRAQRQN